MSYPKAIGPYSTYREYNNLIFVSGQLPLNPDTMQLVSDEIKEQTRQSILNIQAILQELNLDLRHIIKTTIFLADIADFEAMNEIYQEYFSAPYPARSAIAVKDLPKGAKVEIEVVVGREV
ncbi:reactive intermediate/imine deaminase [Helicobacter enhydrae]|uniref:Reactive intermediate/imine deaminase n=1 Tax=Helicobacter enhydrae TaxID=222136 RepID=A0A1B1U5T4_9HELI|nr:Rid family detoxifying hydrolase [Helicobacter enhydrae]ANV98110.1 reactive intermediate/imine deaminase [Helicobacter enhydrae]